MKNYLYFAFVLIGLVSISGCNEDIELTGSYEETAVVYGLLDQSDSIHMIKINRAFIGPGSSLDIAQIPDSSYFDVVDATVTEWINGSVTRTWNLTDTLVPNKDENGIFFAPEQKLYYFQTPTNQPLNEDATYRIAIDINNGDFSISGETGLVKGMETSVSAFNVPFRFADDPGEYISTTVSVDVGNAYLVNTRLNINYEEHDGGTVTQKSIPWTLGEAEVEPNQTKGFIANGETFYTLIANACQNASPSVTRRVYKSMTIEITGGSEDLYNYILVNEPSSSLAQTQPTFTNLEVTNDRNVIGVFSARQTLLIDKPFSAGAGQAFIRGLDKKSTSELCIGPITGPYLFCSDHPGDNIFGMEESYACN